MEGRTQDLPELPRPLNRWAVDRHYTKLIRLHMGDGGPAATTETAYRVLTDQVRAVQAEIPDYVARLGQLPTRKE